MDVKNSAAPDERLSTLSRQRPLWRRLWLFTVAGWLLVLAPSWYMMEVYDRVANTRNGFTLVMLTLAVLLVLGLTQALEWVRAEMLRGIGRNFESDLAPRVFRAAFDSVRLSRPPQGARGPQDLRQLREFASSPVPLALLDAPGALVFLVLLTAISHWVALGALVLAVLQVVLTLLQDRHCQPLLLRAGQKGGQAKQMADSALAHAPTYQALGMTAAAQARWLVAQGESRADQKAASWASGRYQAVSRFLQQLTGSVMLGLAAYLLLVGALPGGGAMLIVASILGGRLMAPLAQVVAHWSALGQARESWQRLGELLTTHPALEPGMPLPRPKGQLQAQALAVPAAPSSGQLAPLLSGIHFQLSPGQAMVVLGPSGAGKTTLVRCLLGLSPGHHGSVRLDGVSVAAWPKDELGPALGYLPQAVDLLDGSLADNICRFGKAQPQALQEAVAAAGLGDWLDSLPQGLDTLVGPSGLGLSAGQRQRVALARAVYGWPPLVVMDEPNASLDTAGDTALDNTLAALKAHACTVVVVSHRTTVLQRADMVLLLQDGAQKAFGPRDEVMQALRDAASRSQQPPGRSGPALAGPARVAGGPAGGQSGLQSSPQPA